MGKKELSYKTSTSLNQAIAYLENLAAGLKTGTLNLEAGAEILSLETVETVDFNLGAAVKKDKAKLAVELSWQTGVPEEPPSGGLRIMAAAVQAAPAAEPEIEAEPEPVRVAEVRSEPDLKDKAPEAKPEKKDKKSKERGAKEAKPKPKKEAKGDKAKDKKQAKAKKK